MFDSTMKASDIRPRNGLITVKIVEQKKMDGRIYMPDQYGDFEVAEIIAVGPGSVLDNGMRTDTADLLPGQKVLIRSGKKMHGPGGQTAVQKNTLEFKVGKEKIEILNQMDILAILPNIAVEDMPEDGDEEPREVSRIQLA